MLAFSWSATDWREAKAPGTIYLRTRTSQVTTVDSMLAAQANPENPAK